MVERLVSDLKYSIRSCARAPAFSVAVLVTLALGIGASTAIFSIVNAILLKPLPLANPERLVYANEVNPKLERISTSWLNYRDWRGRAASFGEAALSREGAATLGGLCSP